MTDNIRTINQLANRRQYFRIEDKASVEVAKLEGDYTAAEYFELNPEFGLISEFQLLDVESKHLLRAVTDKDKNLGQFLKVMNKKLDSLSRVLALNNQSIPKDSVKEINLSEGGLSIPSPHAIEENQRVAIKLILLPSYSGLLLEGKILSCANLSTPNKKTAYELHIEFTDISEAHQQLIARHIMRIQSHKKHL